METIKTEVLYHIKTEEKRKRRSKNDQEGRSYKCETCNKSYLSQPALTNHIKTKHNVNDPMYKRGRGRPRKNVEFLNFSRSIPILLKKMFKNSKISLKMRICAKKKTKRLLMC